MTDFDIAYAALGPDHPLIVRYEEALCGLHVIKQAVASQTMHIDFIKRQIIENYNKALK